MSILSNKKKELNSRTLIEREKRLEIKYLRGPDYTDRGGMILDISKPNLNTVPKFALTLTVTPIPDFWWLGWMI